MHESEKTFHLVKKDDAYYRYIGKRGDRADFGISVGNHPDSFSISWGTALTSDEFLKHACMLIDAVSKLNPVNRPTDTNDPITVVSLSSEQADEEGVIRGRIRGVGSYSGFDYNNVQINGGSPHEYAELTFDKLGWPLNRRDIDKAIELGLGGADRFQVTDSHFVRINAEFCTVIFNGRSKLFTYWSHVPAIEALTRTYEATTIYPGVTEQFRDAVNILVSPDFAQYLSGV